MVNGWKTKKLGEVAEVCMCKRIFAHQTSKIGNIPFYKIGTFGKEADAYISSQLYEEYKAKYSYPEKGDVLISAAGTLGRTVVFDGRPAYFQDSNIVWLKIDKSQLCNDYLAHYYKVIKWASSEGSTISRLYNGIICDTEILLPPLEEQAAIAEALSDVDSLISSLQKLIEKKKAIKQGTMQELLTGKKRLPGFDEEWSNLRIEEIANLHDNLRVPVEKSMREKGNIPYYGANGIQDYVNGYTHNGSYVLIAEDGANDLQEYPIRYASGKMWVNNHVHVLDGKNSVSDTRFLSYSMSTIDYQAAITGGTRAKLNGHILMQLALDLPPLAEQQAIAQVLSDMDGEIEQLEKKLAKYQEIKQGMMQELLSGRIRLVDG